MYCICHCTDHWSVTSCWPCIWYLVFVHNQVFIFVFGICKSEINLLHLPLNSCWPCIWYFVHDQVFYICIWYLKISCICLGPAVDHIFGIWYFLPDQVFYICIWYFKFFCICLGPAVDHVFGIWYFLPDQVFFICIWYLKIYWICHWLGVDQVFDIWYFVHDQIFVIWKSEIKFTTDQLLLTRYLVFCIKFLVFGIWCTTMYLVIENLLDLPLTSCCWPGERGFDRMLGGRER